ncbi:MAG TPA: carboxypeptidase regulatory-like domain-containing protein [Vicinamibacterales bacterium]|nr:carboxypeptidase regulatory-like domain-containing protein [Vicinamibacterales bacterium]
MSNPSSLKTASTTTVGRRLPRLSFSRLQAIVATLAGVASVVGVALSLLQYAQPSGTGELIAVVEAAGSHRGVPDATIEVLTTDNTIVATMAPDASGRATQALKEGIYIVRVSHPRYAADVHRIQLAARQTLEIKTSLRASSGSGSGSGSSSNIERAVNDGVSAVRKALRF